MSAPELVPAPAGISVSSPSGVRWRRLELGLLAGVIVLKLVLLARVWGQLQGFDAGLWLETFDVTRWFEPLPGVRALPASYHPPLSFLAARGLYRIYPHPVEVSQIMSTLWMIGVMLALRSVVRRLGWLWTLPGLWLVYGTVSVPLLVWQAIETSYDPMSLCLFFVALAVSVRLYWSGGAGPLATLRQPRALAGNVVLGLVLAAGMLTKFSGLMALPLPFLVIFARRGLRALVRESVGPVLAVAVAAVVISPIYVGRYYRTEGRFMPSDMEWLRSDVLPAARKQRDQAPVTFVLRNLDFTLTPVIGSQVSARGSMTHSTWLQTWARDSELGRQPPVSLGVSGVYIVVFAVLMLAGTVLFFVRGRRLPNEWRHLGWVLFGVGLMWLSASVVFAWKYPMFDWQVYKAKHVTPYVLWVVFAAVLPLAFRAFRDKRRWQWLEPAAIVLLVAFIALNHLLPVY